MHLPKTHWSPTCSRFQFQKKKKTAWSMAHRPSTERNIPCTKGGQSKLLPAAGSGLRGWTLLQTLAPTIQHPPVGPRPIECRKCTVSIVITSLTY